MIVGHHTDKIEQGRTRPGSQDQDKAGQDLRLMEDYILNLLITFGQRLNTECSCLKVIQLWDVFS